MVTGVRMKHRDLVASGQWNRAVETDFQSVQRKNRSRVSHFYFCWSLKLGNRFGSSMGDPWFHHRRSYLASVLKRLGLLKFAQLGRLKH